MGRSRRLKPQPVSVSVGVPSPVVRVVPTFGRLRGAVERALAVLGSDLKTADAYPLAESARMLADVLDSGGSVSYWREFREILRDLREVTSDDGPSDLDLLLDSLRAEVVDPPHAE